VNLLLVITERVLTDIYRFNYKHCPLRYDAVCHRMSRAYNAAARKKAGINER